MQKVMIFALLFSLLGWMSVTIADDQSEMAKEKMQEMVKRLDLSPTQMLPFMMVSKESMEGKKQILDSYGIDPQNPENSAKPNLRKMRAMRGEMQALNEKTENEMRKVLTPTQMEKWMAIQEENQAEMRENMMESR